MKQCMPLDILHLLLDTNLEWLRQAESLVARVSDSSYSNAAPAAHGNKAGAHLRHVLEFYEAFTNGLATGYIDYDARRRDTLIERSRGTALQKIHLISEQLTHLRSTLSDRALQVRMEDAAVALREDYWLASTAARELQALSSHTVHHFALIAVALRAHEIEVPADFGFSPATLRYQREAA
jgi:hypothetical protein